MCDSENACGDATDDVLPCDESAQHRSGAMARFSWAALIGFALGVVSVIVFLHMFLLPWLVPLFSIPGIIAGHIASSRIKRSWGVQWGSAVAQAGLAVNYVVTILAVYAVAPEVPYWLGYRRQETNEARTIRSLRNVVLAQKVFQAACLLDPDADGVGDYGTLGQLAVGDDEGPFIDPILESAPKNGYRFAIEVTAGSYETPSTYICVAEPVTPNRSGVRRFFADQTGVIRFTDDGTQPNAASPAVSPYDAAPATK
ncbi:MAG TPA: DUF4190 domain-containing protein [Candidatus Hydrogenedentes bacterium]|nr:DUF4190 domain-containing protein [Candidatus Hydrogenedentota bacterium]